jgi:hypothetical protein
LAEALTASSIPQNGSAVDIERPATDMPAFEPGPTHTCPDAFDDEIPFQLRDCPDDDNGPATHWERAAVLAEAAKRPVRNSIPPRPLPSDDTNDSCSSSPIHVVTRFPAVETNREPSILLTDQQIISAVHWCFVDNVDPNFRLEYAKKPDAKCVAIRCQTGEV